MVTVWHRGKAKTIHLLNSTVLRALATKKSTSPLPYDIVEMITTHLTHDLPTLKACSLVCRSWYSAAVQHLHHTFTLRSGGPDISHILEPLSELHELGLMPLVKELRVSQGPGFSSWFVPRVLNQHFSVLASVQTLKLDTVDIASFIPGIERYFGHFSPTLRSIGLYAPYCTPQQLSHFISLFPNLDDIEIWLPQTHAYDPADPDTGLLPFSAPTLRGRLILCGFGWVETWTHLITPYGGLRFRHMDLGGGPCCAPLLLKACAETLETLRLDAREGSLSK